MLNLIFVLFFFITMNIAVIITAIISATTMEIHIPSSSHIIGNSKTAAT